MRWHSHTAFGKNVRGLLAELEARTSRAIKARSELLAAIGKELEIHTSIEDEIFYPAFRPAGTKEDDDKVFFDAMEGHRAAGDLVLPDLPGTDVNSAQFGGRAKCSRK